MFQSSPNRLRWNLGPEDIVGLADALISHVRANYDQIAAVTNPTYENVVAAMANSEAQCDMIENICSFPQYTNPDKAVLSDSSVGQPADPTRLLQEPGRQADVPNGLIQGTWE